MDSQHYNSDDNESQQALDLAPMRQKGEKVLTLDHEARIQVEDLTKHATRKIILNPDIDPRNQAQKYPLLSHKENCNFDNFMTKKKNKDKRKQAFDVIRDMLQQKGHLTASISRVSLKEQRSIMVVRFVNKLQRQNIMQIEDESGKERQKILVKQGVVWVGLICAIEAVFENQMYSLVQIIDLGVGVCKQPSFVDVTAPKAYRMLMVKGPFWKPTSKQNVGAQMIVNEIQNMRYKMNLRVDLVVVMGPVLSQKNELVQNCALDKTFQEEFESIVQQLRSSLQRVVPQIQLLVLPSTDDVTSIYPLPQPAFEAEYTKPHLRYGSNPCRLNLDSANKRKEYQIDFINYDLITYIDQSKVGRAIIEPLQENLQAYLKQPFLLTNTLQDAPFDQTNLGSLFNKGEFGNILVMSSQNHPPFASKVNGRVFVNIGSMGVDYHKEGKHFMTLISVFDGKGAIDGRVKVEAISM